MVIKQKSFIIFALVFILFFSFLLRIYKLGDKPVWFDEATSIAHAEKPISTYFVSPRINYKIVYSVLLNIWVSIFGEDGLKLRFLSVIWGILAVLYIFKLGSFLFDTKTGLLSSFLLGISVFHIFHCQQIRHFSLIVFLSIASVYYFFKFSKKIKKNYIFLIILINILIINTHPYGFFIIIIECVYSIFTFRKFFLKYWVFSQIIVFSFFVLWLALSNRDFLIKLIWWIPKPNYKSLLETLDTFSWGGQRYGLEDFRIPFTWFGLAKFLSGIYFLLFLHGVLLRDKERKSKIFFLLLWLLLPITVSFLLSTVSTSSIYAIKHLIIALPPFCIIIAKSISILQGRLKMIILITILLLNFIPLKIMYDNCFVIDWREGTAYVKSLAKEGELIIISSLNEIVPFMYYYNDEKPSLKYIDIYGKIVYKDKYESTFLTKGSILIIGLQETNVFGNKYVTTENEFMKKVINRQLLRDKSVWLMLSRWVPSEARDFIIDYLDRNFQKIINKRFNGIEVFYYKSLR